MKSIHFQRLKAGDMFRAEVVDIRRDAMKIRLDGGGIIECKTELLPNAHIGAIATFLVKQSADTARGKSIALSIVKEDDSLAEKGFDVRI